MTNMQRRIARVAVVALVLLLSMTAVMAKGQEEPAAAAGPQTVKFVTYESNKEAEHNQMVQDFEAKNPGIKVEIQYVAPGDSAAYGQKTDTMVLSGEAFDMVLTTIKTQYVKRAEDNMYKGLDALFAKEGTKFDDEYFVDSMVNGDHYSLPADVKYWVVYLNMEALAEAGLPLPPADWTWDDYRAYAKKLTKGSGVDKQYGSFLMNRWEHFFNFATYSAEPGMPYFDDKAKTFTPDVPELWSFLKLRKDMEDIDMSQIPSADAISQNLWTNDVFFGGQAAMTVYGTWMIGDIKNTDKWPHTFKTGFALPPRASKDDPTGNVYTENRFYSIPRTSKNEDAAFKFLRYYTTDGMMVKGAGFSASKKNPAKENVINIMTANNASGMYDMDSLKGTLLSPEWKDNSWEYSPAFLTEFEVLRIETSNEYLTGALSLEAAKKKFTDEGMKVYNRVK